MHITDIYSHKGVVQNEYSFWQYFRGNLEAIIIFYLVGTLFIETTKDSEGVLLQKIHIYCEVCWLLICFPAEWCSSEDLQPLGIEYEHVVNGVKQSRFG